MSKTATKPQAVPRAEYFAHPNVNITVMVPMGLCSELRFLNCMEDRYPLEITKCVLVRVS